MPSKRARSGAYDSGICHYCGRHASTDDHIVPRAAFTVLQAELPYWFRAHNIAPACKPCNGFKGSYRSDCECDQCLWVWKVAVAMFLPAGYVVRVRRVISVGVSRL